MAYIKQAFTRYPGIRIAVPSDVDAVSAEILGTDISLESLTAAARDQINEMSEDVFTNILQQGAEAGLDSLPLVPAVMIIATEGRQVLLGHSSLEESFKRGAKRLGESAMFTTLDSMLVALDAGTISIPTITAARIGWKRVVNRIGKGDYMEAKTEEIKQLTVHHVRTSPT